VRRQKNTKKFTGQSKTGPGLTPPGREAGCSEQKWPARPSRLKKAEVHEERNEKKGSLNPTINETTSTWDNCRQSGGGGNQALTSRKGSRIKNIGETQGLLNAKKEKENKQQKNGRKRESAQPNNKKLKSTSSAEHKKKKKKEQKEIQEIPKRTIGRERGRRPPASYKRGNEKKKELRAGVMKKTRGGKKPGKGLDQGGDLGEKGQSLVKNQKMVTKIVVWMPRKNKLR